MAQFLRPDGNVTQTGFTGGFAEIDEATASDADFAYGANGGGNTLEVSLSNPSGTPQSGTTTIHYRVAKVNNGSLSGNGNAVDGTLAIYQGANLIASDVARALSGSWAGYSWTPDLSSVTDWSDLRLRFTDSSNGGSPSGRRAGAISWAEVEAPDPPPAQNGSGSGGIGTATATAPGGTASGEASGSGSLNELTASPASATGSGDGSGAGTLATATATAPEGSGSTGTPASGSGGIGSAGTVSPEGMGSGAGSGSADLVGAFLSAPSANGSGFAAGAGLLATLQASAPRAATIGKGRCRDASVRVSVGVDL